MKLLVVAVLFCIVACGGLPQDLNRRPDVPKLHDKFQAALINDTIINRYYDYSKNVENHVVGKVYADIPSDPDTVNHPFKDYLTSWRHRLLSTAYNGFLFSMTEQASRSPGLAFANPADDYSHGSSGTRLTIIEQDYIDQHPLEFLELMDKAMLTHHNFEPYVRISNFDCAGLDLPKTKFLKLVETDRQYSTRLPKKPIRDVTEEYPHTIKKFSEWRK